MSRPLEICLEDLDLQPEDDAYLRCVALPGNEPGLALDREGAVRWMPEDASSHGLWVSGDDQLVLYCDDHAGPVTVERGDRSLQAPASKPVILVDGDLLRLGQRRLRVHVHGETDVVYEPEPIRGSALKRMLRNAAAALALGSGVLSASGATAACKGIEVRTRPPDMPAPQRPVDCQVVGVRLQPKGPAIISATCPAKAGIVPGSYGLLLHPKTNAPLKNGRVRIKTITGTKVVGEASQLTTAPQGAKLRIYVRN